MTNEEVTDFIKELRKISHQTAMVISMEVAGFIGERNKLLRKAADLIESLQNTLITIDTQALESANLLEDHFKTHDYGEEIK